MDRIPRRLLIPLLALIIAAAALPAGAASVQTTITLPVTADTELRSAEPGRNLGSEPDLYLGNHEGAIGAVALRAPLWRLPRGVVIDRAELQFSVGGWSDYLGEMRWITAARITTPWHEKLATWSRRPAAAEVVGQVLVGTPQAPAWYSIDITSLARGWYTGAVLDHGLLLAGPEESDNIYRTIGSRETTDAPRLIVTYHAAAPPALSLAPAALSFAGSAAAPPAPQPIVIRNDGEESLEWSGTASVGWLTLSPAAGLLAPGQSQQIDVSAATAGVAAGPHTGAIQLSAVADDLRTTQASAAVTFTYQGEAPSLPVIPRSYLPITAAVSTTAQAAVPPAAAKDFVGLYIGLSHYRFLPSPKAAPRAGDVGTGTPIVWSAVDPLTFAETACNCGFPGITAADAAAGTARSYFAGAGVRRQHAPADFLWPATSPVPPPDIDGLVIRSDGVAPAAGPARTLPIDAAGTIDGLRQAFAWLDEREGPGTTVLLTYSGHGAQLPDDNGDEADGVDEAITATDTITGGVSAAGMMRDDEFAAQLAQLESQQVVVILDSCFAGGMDGTASAAPADGLRPRVLPGLARPRGPTLDAIANDAGAPGRIILSASRADELSWESDQLGHGVFTYFLIQGLMDPAADTDHDGWVAAEEAFAYAQPRVDAYVFGLKGVHQRPQMYDGVPGNLNLTRP